MYFCIRDDDTSYFTSPEDLERFTARLAVGGQCRSPSFLSVELGKARESPSSIAASGRCIRSMKTLLWSNTFAKVSRLGVSKPCFMAIITMSQMDVRNLRSTTIWNAGSGKAGITWKSCWIRQSASLLLPAILSAARGFGQLPEPACTWAALQGSGPDGLWVRQGVEIWWRLRQWKKAGGVGVPWVLDLGDHREISGNAVTPFSVQREMIRLSKPHWPMAGSFAWQLTTGRWRFRMCVPVGRQRLNSCAVWSNAPAQTLV